MGKHAKPRPGPGRGIGLSVAATAAVGAIVLGSTPGYAEPQPTLEQAKAQADALYEEAEAATEQYNGAADAVDKLQAQVARLQDALVVKQEAMARQQDAVGAAAAARYRGGGVDPALQLMLSADPADYLAKASMNRQLDTMRQQALDRLTSERRELDQQRREVATRLSDLDQARKDAATRKQLVESKLREAEAVIARLSAADREKLRREEQAAKDAKTAESRAAQTQQQKNAQAPGGVVAPSARAAAAVQAAYAQLGKPYVWGATGPGSFDCSGLTQFVWKAAGVTLPRTTYQQVKAGPTIPKSELQPGDLVFFYSDLHHVGIYIGNGKMIHAPKPGANVEILSIDVPSMPYATAIRP
ncbi:MAG: hypothetical protein HOV66_18725 [Streptomycetaceae bacterium]|nr:hypothetical protein [Streptomycetaceae bacterium]NUS56868.1 hypothetical protein [Streptomycetaceae bacterium]